MPATVYRERGTVYRECGWSFVRSDDFSVEIGRLHRHDDLVLARHQHVLPPVVAVAPCLVAHHDLVESVAHTGYPRPRRSRDYLGDDTSALTEWPSGVERCLEPAGT